MATKAMQAAMKKAAAKAKVPKQEEKTETPNMQAAGEELLKEAFECRDEEGASAGELIVNSKARKKLLDKAGFSFIDVRTLTPNSLNSYTIDEGSIESLASLIYESKNTTPLIVREVEPSDEVSHGMQIVDGERRYRAHLLLGERYGEHWYMAPARIFGQGDLSDADAEFMLHAENVGQRAMTRSERARGVAMVMDRIVQQKKDNPEYAKGKKTREIIAEQFGVSARTAQDEYAIGRNLGEAGMEAYDAGQISKAGAAALSRLPVREQEELVSQVKEGELQKGDVETVAKGKRPSSVKIPKKADDDLKDARKALKRALSKDELPDRLLIAELRNLLDKLDPDKES